MDLNGSAVLVTGASSGIGAALAVALGRAGATVGLLARRGDLLDEVLEQARAAGAGEGSRRWVVDLDDVASAERAAVDAWEAFGGLDGFVSNAALIRRRSALRMPPAELDTTMRVNFLSPAHMALALLPRMQERGSGTIVMVGSIAGRLSSPGEAAYVASKHALAGFTETLAADMFDSAVQVRLVTPGPFDTPIWDVTDDDPTHYSGPKFPPGVAADAIVGVLQGTDTFETVVPREVADTIALKNSDVTAWIAMAAGFTRAGSRPN